MSAPGPVPAPLDAPDDDATSPAPDDATSPAPAAAAPAATPAEGPRRAVTVLGDRVMVAPPDDAERRSKGGILIPATARSVDRKGIWGEAIAVGPHVRHVELGDEVLYLPEDAIEVDVQGEAYLIVRERDVHAVGSARSGVAATGLYL
jgi:chaperonin GroES